MQVSLGGIVVAEYEYNGLHQRTVKRADTTLPFDALDEQRHLYYSASWQLLHEDFLAAPTTIARIGQQLLGICCIDDAICRRLDRTTGPGGGPDGVYDDTYYFITDAQYNTVGLLDDANGFVIERATYTPYGVARHHGAGDLDGDGAVTSTAQALAVGAVGTSIGDTPYNVDADLSRDGRVTTADFFLRHRHGHRPAGTAPAPPSAPTSAPSSAPTSVPASSGATRPTLPAVPSLPPRDLRPRLPRSASPAPSAPIPARTPPATDATLHSALTRGC